MELTDGEKMVFACELSRAITVRAAEADRLDALPKASDGVPPGQYVYMSAPIPNSSGDRATWIVGIAMNDALGAVANLRGTAIVFAGESPGSADVLGSVFDLEPE